MGETGSGMPNLVEIPTKNNPFNMVPVLVKGVPTTSLLLDDPAASCIDFNGDGTVDCAVGYASLADGQMQMTGIWLASNVGSKSVSLFIEEDGRGKNPAWKDPILGLTVRYGHRITCEDLDGNGLIDCIVAREDTCVITYLNNTGSKERAQLTPLPANKNPFLNTEVLLRETPTHSANWSHFNGTYCPARTAQEEPPTGPTSIVPIKGAMSPACADFDLDGGEPCL